MGNPTNCPAKKRPTRLPDPAKRFIIERLACFETVTQVRDALLDEMQLTVALDTISYYDPTTANGHRLARKWKELFNATRDAFKKELECIAIANKSHRLRVLDRMARAAEEKKNFPLVATLLEQAAKECGNFYTNKRELSGPDGRPISVGGPAPLITAVDPIEASKQYMELMRAHPSKD